MGDGQDMPALVLRAELHQRRQDAPRELVVRLALIPARPPVLVRSPRIGRSHLVDREALPCTDVDLEEGVERLRLEAEVARENFGCLARAS